jgi:hypothetical protein
MQILSCCDTTPQLVGPDNRIRGNDRACICQLSQHEIPRPVEIQQAGIRVYGRGVSTCRPTDALIVSLETSRINFHSSEIPLNDLLGGEPNF